MCTSPDLTTAGVYGSHSLLANELYQLVLFAQNKACYGLGDETERGQARLIR
jgi:hypothetical protein